VIRFAFITLFGTLPAVYLSMGSGFAAFFGIYFAVTRGDYSGLFFAVWGIAGICGTWALILATFGFRTRRFWLGLVVGVLAISPLSYAAIKSISIWRLPTNLDSAFDFFCIGPVLVAVYLLTELAWERGGSEVTVDTESYEEPRVEDTGFSKGWLFAVLGLLVAQVAFIIILIGD